MSIEKNKFEKFNNELSQIRKKTDSGDMQTNAKINKTNQVLRDYISKKIKKDAVIDQLFAVKDLFDSEEIILALIDDLANEDDQGFDDEIQEESKKRTVEKSGKIDGLFRSAMKAENDDDLELSKKYLQEILLLDPQNDAAQTLLLKIQYKLEKNRKLENLHIYSIDIGRTDDILDLKELTISLEKELLSDPENRELIFLARTSRIKYEDKAKKQKRLTTVDALAEYEMIIEAVREINVAIANSERNWMDDRSGEIRPITDVAEELTDALPILAKNLFDKIYSKAQSLLPEYPSEAIVLYQEAIALKSLDANSREKAEKELKEAEKDLKRWKKSKKLIEDSDKATNNYQKILLLNQAKSAYIDFPKIEDKFKAVRYILDSMLRGELQEAFIQSKSDFIKNNFESGRKKINQVREKINEYLVDSKSKELELLLKKANELIDESFAQQERQNKVNDLASNIEDALLNGNADLAKKLFENETDLQTESKIQNLKIQFEHKFSVEDKFRNAQQLFDNKKYEECLKSCEAISAPRDHKKDLDLLKNDTKFEILVKNIEVNIKKAYYDEILIAFDDLSRLKLNDQQKMRLKKYEEVKQELNNRLKENKKIDFFEKQLAKYESNHDLKNTILVLNKIVEFQTTKIGYYQNLLNEKGWLLHDEYVEKLKEILFVGDKKVIKRNDLTSEDYAKAFQFVDFLSKYNLMLSDQVQEIKKDVILKHYQFLSEKLEKINAWEDIVKKWKEAKSEFPDVLEIRTEYTEAKRKNLLFQCDQKLQQFDYKPVLNDIYTSEFLYSKDENLKKRLYIAETMKISDEMLSRGEFAEMIEYIDKEISKNNQSELISYKKDRVSDNVIELIKSGDEKVNQGELSEAIGHYASALALDGDNITAQGRISARLNDVQAQLDRLLIDIEEFDITYDTVENKIAEVIEHQKSLHIFKKITNFIDDDGRYQRRIKNNLLKIGKLQSELEDAKNIIDRYDENGETWKILIKNGIWTQLDRDIHNLFKILGNRHIQSIELENQKNKAVSERRDLEKSLDRLYQTYSEENFELAKNEINSIISKISRISEGKDDDPYGLLEEKASVFDVDSGTLIKGLSNIKNNINDLQQNLELWNEWATNVTNEFLWAIEQFNKIKVDLEEDEDILLSEISIPKPQINIIDNIYEVNEKLNKKVEKTVDYPSELTLSGKSDILKKKGTERLNELQQMRIEIDSLIKRYEKSEYYVDLSKLIDEVERYTNERAYIDAINLLEIGLSFDPLNEYLDYLYRICFDKSRNNKKFSFFRKN